MTTQADESLTDGRLIRRARAEDRDACYDICVRTGASGQEATGLYRYPELLGDVFVGPYLALSPDYAFVLDGPTGVVGYVLGAVDTADFDASCEARWWPVRRTDYAAATVAPDSRDAWLLRWIATPPAVPAFVDAFPSHLHIDILPEGQGGGWGGRLVRRLLDAFGDAGSRGVHLGVGRDNVSAVGFYEHLGFREIDGDESTAWMGLALA